MKRILNNKSKRVSVGREDHAKLWWNEGFWTLNDFLSVNGSLSGCGWNTNYGTFYSMIFNRNQDYPHITVITNLDLLLAGEYVGLPRCPLPGGVTERDRDRSRRDELPPPRSLLDLSSRQLMYEVSPWISYFDGYPSIIQLIQTSTIVENKTFKLIAEI